MVWLGNFVASVLVIRFVVLLILFYSIGADVFETFFYKNFLTYLVNLT
jgi:hypothetical protein